MSKTRAVVYHQGMIQRLAVIQRRLDEMDKEIAEALAHHTSVHACMALIVMSEEALDREEFF